jgi:hypothetical protein
MKYPFRFTKSYMADINEIISVKVTNSKSTTIMLTFKTGNSEVIECDSVDNCIEIFERFCDLCNRIVEDRIRGRIKMPTI